MCSLQEEKFGHVIPHLGILQNVNHLRAVLCLSFRYLFLYIFLCFGLAGIDFGLGEGGKSNLVHVW